MGVSLNRLAVKLVDEILSRADELRVKPISAENGATIIDFGVSAVGGYEAGVYLSKVCLAGLARITLHHRDYDGLLLPVVDQFIEHPVLACMASQYAGWKISVGKFFAMGSGPARALAKKPKKLFKEIGYEDDHDEAVLVLETSVIPNREVLDFVAEKCGVKPQNLYVLVASTSSIAGSVQISARIAETGIHRLHTLRFPLDTIVTAAGVCPIAPINPDPTIMMGWTNDALIYAGETYYHVNFEDEDSLVEFVNKAPSSKASSYGKPFYEIFREAEFDFYKIDPQLFAPAKITVYNLKTGRTFVGGSINIDVIRESWGLASR
ncbi:MAG TPA: methenyltetrahydromethanopterin cyclohydrolase [Candidatus Bathyarchaeota archaeon]|nr:methenyltetrahydromethanopterin cyclohydrolase [Candidatus Bathyarchaeota archaeon]